MVKTQDKHRYATGQLLNFARDSYLERTSRPIYAVTFLLPFIIVYEIGTILINTDVLSKTQIRVVAFVWLRSLLEHVGAGDRLAWAAPPLVAIAILLALQVTSRTKWYVCARDFLPMGAECTLLAIPLIVLSLAVNQSHPRQPDPSHTDPAIQQTNAAPPLPVDSASPAMLLSRTIRLAAPDTPRHPLLANIVTGIGAGIYEELVFRLILICLLMMLFQDLMGLSHANAIVLSVLISAALFSAHHHIVFVNGHFGTAAAFTWTQFGFRTAAGVYFAIVFAVRGFAITAGTHAFYDIIATLINGVFFAQ